jgi:tRNA modification GTPase
MLPEAGALQPRHATFTRAVDAHGAAIDEVVATSFPAPGSYTGQDVVEISGHGNPVLLDRLVASAIGAGARLAEPGEFTLRAFLHGRIDLSQAEAVGDLIEAVTPVQARAAFDQLEGTLTQAIARIDAPLFDLIAKLEASVDFPDEGYHFITPREAAAQASAIAESLAALIARGREGRLVREGAQVVLAGRPNTGKSSLFNALAGSDRAIVTEVPGTTRDLVTDIVDINGLAITLVDTAGVRETMDVVESEGVGRAERAVRVADCVVVVLDGSQPLQDADRALLAATGGRARVVAINKSDLPPHADHDDGRGGAVRVSARSHANMTQLRDAIEFALMGGRVMRDVPAVTNQRHLALLERAHESIARATDALAHGLPEELALADLQEARGSFDEIVGRRTTDDLLRHIFSRFCIGK